MAEVTVIKSLPKITLPVSTGNDALIFTGKSGCVVVTGNSGNTFKA